MDDFDLLDTLAAKQYGVVSMPQLLQLGFSRHQVRDMRSKGRLIPMRQGIYRVCGSPLSWRSRAFAAVLVAGRESVLSHRSAGTLWGLLARQGEAGRFEVTCSKFCRPDDLQVHRNRLEAAEQTIHLGIPVTTPARTLLDLGQTIGPDHLGAICDEALRRRLVTLTEVRQAVDRHAGSGRRRLNPLRAVLSDRDPGYNPGANPWEQEMDRMWDRMSLPPAVRQYPIQTQGRLYIPDRAIVDLKVAVEWNGYERHGLRSRFDYDSDRRADLAAAGWYPLDFTSRSTPALICRTVLAVVEERRRLFGLTA